MRGIRLWIRKRCRCRLSHLQRHERPDARWGTVRLCLERIDEAAGRGEGRRLRSGSSPEHAAAPGEMKAHGANANAQPGGNLLIGEPTGRQMEDLPSARRQTIRVLRTRHAGLRRST